MRNGDHTTEKQRFTEAGIPSALRQADSRTAVVEIMRKLGSSEPVAVSLAEHHWTELRIRPFGGERFRPRKCVDDVSREGLRNGGRAAVDRRRLHEGSGPSRCRAGKPRPIRRRKIKRTPVDSASVGRQTHVLPSGSGTLTRQKVAIPPSIPCPADRERRG